MQSSMPELQHAGDESDSVPSGLDEMSDGEGSDNDANESGSDESHSGDIEVDDEVESAEGGSIPDDLSDSDGPLEFEEDPDDLLELSGGAVSSSDEEILRGKRKRLSQVGDKKAKRKKLRKLPTFASAEDYAKMIDEAPEEDI